MLHSLHARLRLLLLLLHSIHLCHAHPGHFVGRWNSSRRRWSYNALLLLHIWLLPHRLLPLSHLLLILPSLSSPRGTLPRLPSHPGQSPRQRPPTWHRQPLLRHAHDQVHGNREFHLVQSIVHRISIAEIPYFPQRVAFHARFGEELHGLGAVDEAVLRGVRGKEGFVAGLLRRGHGVRVLRNELILLLRLQLKLRLLKLRRLGLLLLLLHHWLPLHGGLHGRQLR
mmetsp:Transcript_18138/g.37845  ORF Transcript_18138/g.37845 Transcript_18138/m.37845 type:complete len:226 (-) Transcript_18138:222-899(-)